MSRLVHGRDGRLIGGCGGDNPPAAAIVAKAGKDGWVEAGHSATRW